MIIYEYEQIDLHGEKMCFVRLTDTFWKKDPDKLLGNSKERASPLLLLDRASGYPTFLSSSLHSVPFTQPCFSQHEFRGLSKFKWEVPG